MRPRTKVRRRGATPEAPPVVTAETIAAQRAAGLLSRVTVLPLLPPDPVRPATPPVAAVARPTPARTDAETDMDATRVRRRDHDLRLPDGSLVPITTEPIVVGRAPSTASPDVVRRDGSVVVTVSDPGRALSREHLRIDIDADGTIWASDLGSGNGTTLISTTGEVQRLSPHRRTRVPGGSALSMGGHTVTVVRRRPPGEPEH